MKLISILVLVLWTEILFGQERVDGNFIFKTWFFLERQNEIFSHGNKFNVKGALLFSFLDSIIELRADTLKTKGFSKNFLFLLVAPYKKGLPFHDSSIVYKSFISKPNEEIQIGIPIDYCNGYVLCINSKSGKSFRIQGFYGNDFLSLMEEVKAEFNDKVYNQEQKLTLSTNSFLENYYAEGLDFKCLFKGLTAGVMDNKKYPCLTICKNSIVVIK